MERTENTTDSMEEDNMDTVDGFMKRITKKSTVLYSQERGHD